MDITQLYRQVQSIIKSILNLPNGYIRLADQNAPMKSAADHAIMIPISIVDSGSHHKILKPNGLAPADNFTETVGSKYLKTTFMLTFYGEDANTHASNLVAQRNSSQWRRLWYQSGLSFIDLRQIDLTNLMLNEQNYKRSILNLVFYAKYTVNNTVNAIDISTIRINGQVAEDNNPNKLNFTAQP